MPIDTPAQQGIDIILYTVLYPVVIGVPLGMFLKFLSTPFRLFIGALFASVD